MAKEDVQNKRQDLPSDSDEQTSEDGNQCTNAHQHFIADAFDKIPGEIFVKAA